MGTEIDSSWENTRLKERLTQLEAELAECKEQLAHWIGEHDRKVERFRQEHQERDALAAIVQQQRDTLGDITNYPHKTPEILRWAREALALDVSQASQILAKRDAEVLRRAAERLANCQPDYTANDWLDELRHMADELEKQT